ASTRREDHRIRWGQLTLECLNEGCADRTVRPDFEPGEIGRRAQWPVRAEVLETARLPPSKDTDPGLGPEILRELLPKGAVQGSPCILLRHGWHSLLPGTQAASPDCTAASVATGHPNAPP